LTPASTFPFFGADRRGVDLEAVVPSQLAVAAIELRRPVDREGRADHRCLQVVRHDRLDDAAELRERLHMQCEPRLDLLVEDHAHDHVPAVAQHHHEAPRLAQRLGGGIVELADVPEVDLCDRARSGIDGDRDVLRLDAARLPDRSPEPLDRRVRTEKRGVFEAEPIVDRPRLQALRHEGLDQPFQGRSRVGPSDPYRTV